MALTLGLVGGNKTLNHLAFEYLDKNGSKDQNPEFPLKKC